MDCASCGRHLEEGATFCTACGQRVPTAETRVPARAGRVQEPWVVVLLTIVTLQVYLYLWAWRVSREVDAWRGGGDAHAAVRRGVVVGSLGAVVFLAAFVAAITLGTLASDPVPDAEALTADPFAGLSPGLLVLLAGGIVVGSLMMLAGAVWFFVGLWRVWRVVEEEAKRRGGRAFSAVLMLVLSLVPYVNLVGGPYAQFRTQQELNAMWAATPAPVVPAPWRG